jgi:hypothetical protein
MESDNRDMNDEEPIELPEPAPSVIALGAAEPRTISPHVFLRGPLLLTSVGDGGRIEVMNGHPAEASSRTLCRLNARDMPPGGVWIAPGMYVISPAETAVSARFAWPCILELSATRSTTFAEKQSTSERLAKLLDRFGVVVLASKLHLDREDIAVEVPLSYYERVLEVLDRMGITVSAIRGQLDPLASTRRRSHLRSVPEAPANE